MLEMIEKIRTDGVTVLGKEKSTVRPLGRALFAGRRTRTGSFHFKAGCLPR